MGVFALVLKVVGYARSSPGSPPSASQVGIIVDWVGNQRDKDGKAVYELGQVLQDDQVSGKTFQRIGFEKALVALNTVDGLVTTKLDRLGRSAKEMLEFRDYLTEHNKFYLTCDHQVDTRNASGNLMFMLASVFAQWERELICERTKAGRERALARGVQFGRKRTPLNKAAVLALRRQGFSFAQIANVNKCSPSTVFAAVKRWRGKNGLKAVPPAVFKAVEPLPEEDSSDGKEEVKDDDGIIEL